MWSEPSLRMTDLVYLMALKRGLLDSVGTHIHSCTVSGGREQGPGSGRLTWMGGWVNGWMSGWVGRWCIDGWIHGYRHF